MFDETHVRPKEPRLTGFTPQLIRVTMLYAINNRVSLFHSPPKPPCNFPKPPTQTFFFSFSLSLHLFFLQFGHRHCGVFGLDPTEIRNNVQNAKEACVAQTDNNDDQVLGVFKFQAIRYVGFLQGFMGFCWFWGNLGYQCCLVGSGYWVFIVLLCSFGGTGLGFAGGVVLTNYA